MSAERISADFSQRPHESSRAHTDPAVSGAENLPSPENTRSLLLSVKVAGPSYAGKGLLTGELKLRYGWEPYNGKDEFMRRVGYESGQLRNKLAQQKNFDSGQLNKNLSLRRENAQLDETRLSGIILAEARDIMDRQIKARRRRRKSATEPEPTRIPAVSLLLWAEAEVRYERAYQVAFTSWIDQQERLARGESLREDEALIEKEPTRGSVTDLVRQRQEADVHDWSRLKQHRNYIGEGVNPFSRNLMRPNGLLVYDWVIDTSDKTPKDVADEFVRVAPEYGVLPRLPIPSSSNSTSERFGEPMPEYPKGKQPLGFRPANS